MVANALGVTDTSFSLITRWRPGIVRGFVASAKDPEVQLSDWLEFGAPTGVGSPITSCGVFSKIVSTGEASKEFWRAYAECTDHRNYKSADENKQLLNNEVNPLLKENFVKRYDTLEEAVKLHGKVFVSKVAAIVKMRQDGTPKLRIIIEMLRSMVNSFVRLEERIILPRLADMISDLIALARALEIGSGQVIDMSVFDFSDAFHTIGVALEELRFQVFRLPDKGYGVYRTAVFGGGGSPLTWGRAAAFLSRFGQSLFDISVTRLEIYVDDPWTAFRGSAQGHTTKQSDPYALVDRRRTRAVLGQNCPRTVSQMDWSSSDDHQCRDIFGFPDDYAKELAEEAERFMYEGSATGRHSKADGSVLMGRWICTSAWLHDSSLLGDHSRLRSRRLVREECLPEDPSHTDHQSSDGALLDYCFYERRAGTLTRTFDACIHTARARTHMEFDASPWGYVGVLFIDGIPTRYFAENISNEDLERFSIKLGENTCQAVVENFAMLIGVRMWLETWRSQRFLTTIRTDSMAAVGAWSKERSSTPAINQIVRELALDLAEGLYDFDYVEHIAGTENILADSLSRLAEPEADKVIPHALAWAARDTPPVRLTTWWRVSAGPPEEMVG